MRHFKRPQPKPLYSKEELEDIENLIAFAQKEFRDWVFPWFAPAIERAAKLGWKCGKTSASLWNEHPSGLRVMLSGNTESDGNKWLHLSVSRKDRLPKWDELKAARAVFLTEDLKALQIFPPKEEYVNDNPFVLHLWVNLTKDPLPDFRTKLPGGKFTI